MSANEECEGATEGCSREAADRGNELLVGWSLKRGGCIQIPPTPSEYCSRTEICLQLFPPGSSGAGQRFAPTQLCRMGIYTAPVGQEGDVPPHNGPGGGFAPFLLLPPSPRQHGQQPGCRAAFGRGMGQSQPLPCTALAVTQFRDSAVPPPTPRSEEIKPHSPPQHQARPHRWAQHQGTSLTPGTQQH